MTPSQKDSKRFAAKVSLGSSFVTSGYGSIRVSERAMRAHRLAWEEAHGPIPDGLCVFHSCESPACTDPGHLFIGTQADNIAARRIKRRNDGLARLNANVLAIRSL